MKKIHRCALPSRSCEPSPIGKKRRCPQGETPPPTGERAACDSMHPPRQVPAEARRPTRSLIFIVPVPIRPPVFPPGALVVLLLGPLPVSISLPFSPSRARSPSPLRGPPGVFDVMRCGLECFHPCHSCPKLGILFQMRVATCRRLSQQRCRTA